MTKIEEFLTKFDDQHLANLQCAVEDGTLVYHDCNRCLLHHQHGNYSETKWEGEDAPLARDAEAEYRNLGPIINPFWGFAKTAENARRKAILPMIQAEWARRAKKVVPAETTPAELTPCSPAVR